MPQHEQLKREICEIGRRIYLKGFAAANEGNISARIDDDHVLCTPTLHCKGFLEPADICLVDMTGRQLGGEKKRTSEVLLHLEIYRQRPDVRAIVHCHPPHPTAFAIAREPIPQCVLPEAEVFLGEVPIAPYATPGSQAFADTIRPFVEKSKVIVLANHGTVSFDQTVERAYWWTEILDAYCRILILTRSLSGFHYLSSNQARELLEIKKTWGIDDPRHHSSAASSGNVCSFPTFASTWSQTGVKLQSFPPHSDEFGAAQTAISDELVERIAQRLAQLLQSPR
jgi:L-fuculose-phosphate aldolase